MISRPLLLVLLAAQFAVAQKHVPSIDELMSVETAGGSQISPVIQYWKNS